MALPQIKRGGEEAVDYGERDFTQEVKAIGGQMARFEELRETAGNRLSEAVQASMRKSLSFQDRVKFDIGRMGDQNIRILNDVLQEQVRKNTQVTSDSAKLLQDRVIFLTKRLLDADAVEAKIIANELREIRTSAKGLAKTERDAIDELATVSSQGLGEISLLKDAFFQSLPTAESFVESALGGGFVGKLAGNVMRVRKERKQRKAALAGELEGTQEFGPQPPIGMQPPVSAGAQGMFPFMNESDDTLGKIAENTKDSAQALQKSLKGNVEQKKEQGRRDERLLDALEDLDGEGGGVTVEEPEKEKGGIMGIINSVMGGLSLLGTGLRLIKNPKLAFRFFRMKLFRNVISPLKKGLGSIFGKGGMLRNLLGGVGGFFKNLAGTVSSGVKSAIGGVTSLVSKAAASPVGQAVTSGAKSVGGAVSGAAKSVGGAIGKGAKALGKTKAGGFFSRLGGSLMKGVKAVGGGIASAGKAIGGVAMKAGGAVAGAAKFVGAKAKMAKDLLKSPVKFLTTKLGPKAGGTLGKFAKKIPLVGGAIEALMSGIDIMAIKNDPEMSPQEKKEAIGKRIGAGLGGIIGAVGGGVLGNLIPIPIVGGLVGSLLGDLAGRYVGEAIAGAIGGEKIYDALSFMLPDVGEEQKTEGAEGEGPSAGTGVGSASPRTASSRSALAAESKAKMRAKQDLATKLGMDPTSPAVIGGMEATITSVEGEGKDAVYKAEAKIRGKPIGAGGPRTQAQADFIGAGTAQNRGMETAMASAGGTEVSNAVQSNSAITNNQFMGGSLRSRNTHETLDRVAQDRLAYGLA